MYMCDYAGERQAIDKEGSWGEGGERKERKERGGEGDGRHAIGGVLCNA